MNTLIFRWITWYLKRRGGAVTDEKENNFIVLIVGKEGFDFHCKQSAILFQLTTAKRLLIQAERSIIGLLSIETRHGWRTSLKVWLTDLNHLDILPK